MSRPLLLLTRPAAETARTAAAAMAAGFDVLSFPLLEMEALDWEPPAGPFQAILFTSARAPALVADRAPGLVALPVYAVGPRTAEVAAAAGFRIAGQGLDDGVSAAKLAAGQGIASLLHLGGEDRAPLPAPQGLQITHVPVYAARRVEALSGEIRQALAAGRVLATLLFSARTARHFGSLVADAGLEPAALRVVVLSAAVAAAAGAGWASVAIAARPDVAAMLAASHSLWQGLANG
ncbi:MAG: uroporphyrinogen-III synthase [Sandaracinobacteroides sp.]